MSFKKSLLAAGLVAASSSAFAFPTLDTISSGSLSGSDTGAQTLTLNDIDGTNDTALATLLLESAGLANNNSFGFYGYTVDLLGNIILGDMLEVFSGPDSTTSGAFGLAASTTVWFDMIAGNAWIDDACGTAGVLDACETGKNINGSSFGVYLQNSNTFYSHTSLNTDGTDHSLIFDTTSYNDGVVVAFEDLLSTDPGFDGDYNDLVVSINDVSAVSEPGTLALLGLGLAGLGFARRKQAKA